ncbi:MAG: hypothetical protein ACOC22_04445 [bacterium]
MYEENTGMKNTAIIDIDRYNQLLDKETALDSYYDDDFMVVKFRNSYRGDVKYKVLTENDAIHEIGAIHNELVKNTVDIRNVELLKEDVEGLEKTIKKKNDVIIEQRNELIKVHNMTIKEFKKWRRERHSFL